MANSSTHEMLSSLARGPNVKFTHRVVYFTLIIHSEISKLRRMSCFAFQKAVCKEIILSFC